MSSKERLVKYTAYYRCPEKIDNFKIRIRYKELDDGDIANESDNWNARQISWQEKCFSRYEKELYGDIHNCVTELDRKYHEKLLSIEEEEDFTVFTYVDEDEYIYEQEIYRKPTYLQQNIQSREDFNTPQKIQNEFDYAKSLSSCIEDNVLVYNLEKMCIMADLGDYIESIWIKNEQPLCIIHFNKDSKLLSVYPDFTSTQPYYTKVQGETIKHFYYFIEHCSEYIPEHLEMTERDLIKNLTDCKISLKKQIIGHNFFLPPKNKLYVYIFFEILSAKSFEYSDVYVQYFIDLPKHWSCPHEESLKGRTQICHGINEDGLLHFGHCFDIVMEYNIQSLQEICVPKTPYIYFEVISKSTWDRYRTEGLTYINLPVSKPGPYSFKLACTRYADRVTDNLRRFFIGDCSNYRDIRCIGLSNEYEGKTINRFGIDTIGSGQLNVRINVLHQSQAFMPEFNGMDRRENLIYEKLKSSSLIKSVEQVLQAFRRARKNMMEVRKNM